MHLKEIYVCPKNDFTRILSLSAFVIQCLIMSLGWPLSADSPGPVVLDRVFS